MEPVTIKHVAERLGVAVSSVSRVLNDHPDVSDVMRRRVREAADELGYQPDYLAQSLRRGATLSVGFLLRDLSNPIFADIVKGAETILRAHGYSLILINADGDPSLDAENLRVLRQRRVDGLLLSLQSESHPLVSAALRTLDIPVVLIDREVAGVDASIVRCDHRRGVSAATEHLLSLGHERIGLVSGPADILATRERVGGFRDAHASMGLGPDEALICLGAYTREFGYEQTVHMLSLGRPPTAILSAGTQSTTGVLMALDAHDLRVGKDVSLVSCDEQELMQFLTPPISVVRRDATMIGRLAATLILERLEGDAPARDAVVPTQYVPHGSSAPPPPRG